MVRSRSLPALCLIAAATLSACRTVRPDATVPPVLAPARAPEVAIADAAAIKDPVRAAEIAWIEGNDRAFAKKRLQGAQQQDPSLQLLRALIASIELDGATERAALLELIQKYPETAEAEVALLFLQDWLSDHLDARAEIEAALRGLLADPPPGAEDRAARVALASSILSRIDALDRDEAEMKRDLARGGWLANWRAIGPLAPALASSLETPTEQETIGIDVAGGPRLRGLEPPVRDVEAWRIGVAPLTGDLPGLYVMETYVELSAEAASEPLILQIHARDSGRVLVDGTRVHTMRNRGRTARAYKAVKLKLAPGWHRVSVAVLATIGSRPSFSLLSANGAPVIARQQNTPPPAGTVRTPPVVAVAESALSADGLVERLIASPDRALFGHFLGGVLAMAHSREDLDRAKRLLTTAVEMAPKSSLLITAQARLQARSGLPQSLSQARYRDALALDPENPSLLLRLARSIHGDQPDAALAMIDRAEKSAPYAAEPHELRFRIHQTRGWNAEAARSLEKALGLRSTESLLAEGATFYRNLLRFERSKELEQRALALTEPSPGTRAAGSALLAGDVEAAIRSLREAARSASSPASHLVRIAGLELGRGRFPAAIEAAKEALASDPLHSGALRTLAIASRAAADPATAKAAIEKLRTIGAADIRAEVFTAELAENTPGLPAPGSWLAKELSVDPRALVMGAKDIDPRFQRYKSVRLLDRVIDRVASDGHSVSTRHAIVRLQTKEATDQAGETNLPNDALTLALRTIKADGRIIDVDRHSGKEDLSFSALAPGDAVEKQWVAIDSPATAWGGYLRRFFFQGAAPSLKNEYAVTFPSTAKVWWKSYHGAPSPIVHEEGAETTYIFRATNVAAVDPEPASVSQEEYLPFVVVAIGIDEQLAYRANISIADELANSSWEVDRQAQQLAAKAKSEREKLMAIYNFVSEEIDDGEANEPSIVLATRRGDRTRLFLAMLRAVELDATLVLARPGSAAQVSPAYPAASRYANPLVRIAIAEPKETIWARMDKANTWMGKAPPEMRGGEYILPEMKSQSPKPIAFEDGEVERWKLDSNVDLAIDARGNAKGTVTLELPGTFGSSLREFLETARADDIHRALQEWVAAVLPGAQLEKWSAKNQDQPLLPLVLEASLLVPSFMVLENEHLIAEQFFEAPIATHALGLPSLAAYLRLPVRVTPLWISEVGEHMKVSIALPNGTRAPVEAPRKFSEESRWGRFVQTFTYDPAERRAKLEVEQQLPAQRVSPQDFPKFREAAQQILQASRNRLIVPIAPAQQVSK